MAVHVIVRGGGDLASGVILRLFRAGVIPVVLELSEPFAVRRTVSFAEAVYAGETMLEEATARRVELLDEALALAKQGRVPVLVDPGCKSVDQLRLNGYGEVIMIDGRMIKRSPGYTLDLANLLIGLGPGFSAGQDCHAVVETQRGHFLGRVIWDGTAEPDTGLPEGNPARVLRAPTSGIFQPEAQIGDHLEVGERVASVNGEPLFAAIRGVLRGSLHAGLRVEQGMKVGDIDPRDDPRYCHLVSDKALAIGGGVLEAILSRENMRSQLWG